MFVHTISNQLYQNITDRFARYRIGIMSYILCEMLCERGVRKRKRASLPHFMYNAFCAGHFVARLMHDQLNEPEAMVFEYFGECLF